jgi:hypothetical protein
VVSIYFCNFAPSNNKKVGIMVESFMTEKEKQSMIEDAMIVISGDMFQCIYNLGDLGWVYVTNVIKDWAREFVNQLDWKGQDDERDWLMELEKFEIEKFEEFKKDF